MSAILAIILLGGAAWFVLKLAGGGAVRREPMDSVNEFSRAMSALDPLAPPRPAVARPSRPARPPARR